jgi:O-methyltransferase involved in polyketide biosynthesis
MRDADASEDASGAVGQQPGFDPSVPNIARIYDYLLGGKDHFEVDRAAAEMVIATVPGMVASARANRAFLGRAVRYLAGEAGIRQFLDIGSGMPSVGNTHEIAQDVAPTARVVYVDNDPVVITHARALLESRPEGASDYIGADLRNPGKILTEAARTLDLTRPVAVMLLMILHFIPDDEAYDAVSAIMSAVAPGSFLVIGHMPKDIEAESVSELMRKAGDVPSSAKMYPRTREEVARFFAGLEFVEPGLVTLEGWHPAAELDVKDRAIAWGGVARKP